MRNIHKRLRPAFTMLELIFVIVIMGILGKYGAEIFKNTYDSYILSSVQNKLQTETELTLQQIGNRLQYRIKNSVIARKDGTTFHGLSTHNPAIHTDYIALEWVGYDIDGWLGVHNGAINLPTWSGFMDVDSLSASNTILVSPGTDTSNADTVIQALTANATTIDDAAVFFTGENSDVLNDFGWNHTVNHPTAQSNVAAHPIQDVTGQLAQFQSGATMINDFNGTDIYEQYKLSWTAYALVLENQDAAGNYELALYHNYQPWLDEAYTSGTRSLLLENVSETRVQAIGDIFRIQLCVANDGAVGNYSICKEKAVF